MCLKVAANLDGSFEVSGAFEESCGLDSFEVRVLEVSCSSSLRGAKPVTLRFRAVLAEDARAVRFERHDC